MTAIATGTEDLLTTFREGVLTVCFNRPTRRNAMTGELELAYLTLLKRAERESSVRAVVVTGAGGAFCSGADLSALQAATENPVTPGDPHSDPTFPLSFRKPLIAAVDGPCIGLGFAEALFCDVRFASTEAKFSTAFARRGLIAEYGLSWLLPQVIGRAHALDLLMTGRTIAADEAERIGLVRQVTSSEDVVAAAHAYAVEVAQFSSPTSIAVIKEQINADAGRDMDGAVTDAFRLMAESFERPDLIEGVTAHFEKRPPLFANWNADS